METINLTCIGCPLGCDIAVQVENGNVLNVEGNTCPKGEQYAKKEVTNPTRIITSSVKLENSTLPSLSVKTKEDIPKDKIFDCVNALKNVSVKAPVKIGDVVLEDVAGTGVDIIATKNAVSI